jgi:uncharacterized short protein YbdD (DUF466 family)
VTGGERSGTARPAAGLSRVLRQVHWYLREVTGESGYDKYLARHEQAHPGTEPMSRREFERRRMDERDARPQSRCC